jgi:hypothetical protein
VELVGRSKQKRTVNAEDGDVVRDRLVLQDVRPPGLDVCRASPLETVVVRATRLMNRSAAITMPTSTATVRSANTVSRNVTAHTRVSA